MPLTMLLFAAAFLVFAGLVLLALIHADRQRRRHQARLRRVRTETSQDRADTPRKPVAGRRSHGLFARIERQIEQTNSRITLAELMVQVGVAVLGVYALAVLFVGLHLLIALPLAVILPVGLAGLWLRMAKARYRAAFTADLPEALDVFARGLRAGRPVSESLSIVVDTAKGPVQREFSRCRDEISMGTSLPDSLGRLEGRVPTAEVSFFAVATSLQAETGGNLIETMEGLAGQLRERRKLRKKARALSSEARASAFILAALPFAVALAILLLNGAYLEPLYADPRGRVMAVGALTSIGLGVYMMARMGRIDV